MVLSIVCSDLFVKQIQFVPQNGGNNRTLCRQNPLSDTKKQQRTKHCCFLRHLDDALHGTHIETALTADALILQNVADPAHFFDTLHWTDLLTRSTADTAAAIDLKRHSHPSSQFYLSLCIYPVSYTHLDVYKRQSIGTPVIWLYALSTTSGTGLYGITAPPTLLAKITPMIIKVG